MPTPRLQPGHETWPRVLEVMRLVKAGVPLKTAAERLGENYETAKNWKGAYERWENTDPAILDAMGAAGTGLQPALTWVKTKNEDGTSYSVLLKPPQVADDILQRIRDAFEGMEPAEPTAPPENTVDDLLTLYPVFDAHIGMMAWGKETSGPDYDLKIAQRELPEAFEKVLALTPHSAEAILLIGGDYFHIDDSTNETPASKHGLDVDGRFFKVVDTGVAIMKRIIPRLLSKHNKVTVRVLRGNHDEHSHIILTYALAEYFSRDGSCTIEKDPRVDLFMRQWGRCAIFAHHGDRRWKPERAALYISDICDFWSDTRFRHMFTGHVHHDSAKDVGPLKWESLRAFAPPDAYAATMGYTSRRAVQAITFHKQDGIVLRAYDPVE